MSKTNSETGCAVYVPCGEPSAEPEVGGANVKRMEAWMEDGTR